jgi:hypothetical protein
VNKSEDNQGFIISWQEPPLTSPEWSAGVATRPVYLDASAKAIIGRTRDEMISEAHHTLTIC